MLNGGGGLPCFWAEFASVGFIRLSVCIIVWPSEVECFERNEPPFLANVSSLP